VALGYYCHHRRTARLRGVQFRIIPSSWKAELERYQRVGPEHVLSTELIAARLTRKVHRDRGQEGLEAPSGAHRPGGVAGAGSAGPLRPSPFRVLGILAAVRADAALQAYLGTYARQVRGSEKPCHRLVCAFLRLGTFLWVCPQPRENAFECGT
jgi:hypothetical protein